MDDLIQKLKALKPDEPDAEIANDVNAARQSGMTDDEIYTKAQALVQSPTPAAQPPAAPPSTVPTVPSAPDPVPAEREPMEPMPDFSDKPDKFTGRDAAVAALQGLAGLGDAITRSYGGGQSDYLKTAMAAEQQGKENRLARQKAVAESIKSRRQEKREETALGIEKAKADAAMMKNQIDAMQAAGKTKFEQEEKLRDGFSGAAKTYTVVRDQFGALQAAAKDPSAAGDLALIFAYMKLVDPGSTVREGEFANAQNSAGLDEKTRSIWNRALTGERLTPKVRADFVGQSEKLYKSHEQTFNATKALYTELANAYQLNPDRVTKIIVGQAATPHEGAPTEPSSDTGGGGLSPDKKKRLEELRKKKAAGTLQ